VRRESARHLPTVRRQEHALLAILIPAEHCRDTALVLTRGRFVVDSVSFRRENAGSNRRISNQHRLDEAETE